MLLLQTERPTQNVLRDKKESRTVQIVDDVIKQIKKMNAHEFNDFLIALEQFDPWLFEDGTVTLRLMHDGVPCRGYGGIYKSITWEKTI